MSAQHDTVFAVAVSSGKYLVGTVWVDLHHQESRTPAEQRMTGRERLMRIEFFLQFRHQRVLVEADERSRAAIAGLGQRADTVASSCSFEQHLVNLRRVLLRNLHAESLFKLCEDGCQSIYGVAGGLCSTLGVL